MLSRALILATVMLSILAAAPEAGAQNLDAGKSASQIFSSTCAVCHRSQRGLLKTVQPGALPGFLREHYTTSRDMAGQLSAYLLSNGATDPRGAGGRLTKQGQDAKSGGGEPAPADQQGRRPRPGQPQEAARPDADGLSPIDPRTGRPKQNRADQQPVLGPDGQPVDPPQSRQKQKMGKKKGREEAPKETPPPVEASKPDADTQKPDAAPVEMPKPPEPAPVVIDPKIDAPKPESVRPAESVRPNGTSSEMPATRPDPVPQVTPAPKPSEPESRPDPGPSAPPPSEAPAASPAPAPEPSSAPAPSEPPRPTISVTPPPPPPAPLGSPVPPISQ